MSVLVSLSFLLGCCPPPWIVPGFGGPPDCETSILQQVSFVNIYIYKLTEGEYSAFMPKKQTSGRTVIIATRITKSMYDELAEMAKQNFRSVAAEMLFAINAHLCRADLKAKEQ